MYITECTAVHGPTGDDLQAARTASRDPLPLALEVLGVAEQHAASTSAVTAVAAAAAAVFAAASTMLAYLYRR